MCRLGTGAEIVYESRGKLIGGSLSRERTVEKSTIRNEGGDSIYVCIYVCMISRTCIGLYLCMQA